MTSQPPADHTDGDHADGWRQRVAGAADFVRRRAAGDYEVDESGFDPDFHASVVMPVTRAIYRDWRRVRRRGGLPVRPPGPALVVANPGGVRRVLDAAH